MFKEPIQTKTIVSGNAIALFKNRNFWQKYDELTLLTSPRNSCIVII